MTSKFEFDLYFMMLYPSVKFVRNCSIHLKVIDGKPQYSQNLSKKGHNSFKNLQMTSFYDLGLYFMMLYPSVKFEWNWYVPSKVNDWKPRVWRRDADAIPMCRPCFTGDTTNRSRRLAFLIWVFTVYKSICLGVSRKQRVIDLTIKDLYALHHSFHLSLMSSTYQ